MGLADVALADPLEDACIASAVDGQKLRKGGNLRAARETFVTCARIECPKEITERCTGWLGELEQAIPSLVLSVQDDAGRDGLDGEVRIDGAAYGDARSGKAIELDPGMHLVEAITTHGSTKADVVVREGERARIIRLVIPIGAPPPALTPKPTPGGFDTGWGWAALAAVGIGVVATGFTIGFGTAGVIDRDRFKCGMGCSPSNYQQVSNEFIAAEVMFGVSVVSLGAGVVFWLLSRSSTPPPKSAMRW